MSTPLLKLYKGSYTTAQLLEKCTEGAIVFDKNTKRIYAGTDSSTPFMFGSNVQDAVFDKTTDTLKIWKVGDEAESPSVSLNFSDIASASAMMAVFQEFADKMGLDSNKAIDYSGTTYLSDLGGQDEPAKNLVNADKALDSAIKALSDKVDNLDVTEYEQAAIDTITSPTETTFKVKSIKEVDGKISAGTGTTDIKLDGSYNASTNKIASVSTVTSAIQALDVTEYAQASVDVDTTNHASTLKIKSIKEDDGQIAAGTSTPTFDVEIDGEYDASTNKVATKSTVTNAINALDTQSDVHDVVYTAADSSNGAKLTFKGVSETNGVVAQGSGSAELQFAKVATSGAAGDVSYTNTSSGLSATNAQSAIDELDTRIDALEGSFNVIISTDAATTPAGVKWMDGQTEVTGTLAASADTWHKIYLVPSGSGKDSYQEYITLRTGTAPSYTYSWEKLGNTSVDLLGYVKTITVNGKSYPVDTNSTNVTLIDMITSITGETAISGGESDLVAVTATTTKNTTNGTNATVLASSVKVEEVADGIVKDGGASYSDGHYVIENNKLVSAVGKSSGDTYTISANDGLTKASDVKAYVDSAITDASFRWSEWA